MENKEYTTTGGQKFVIKAFVTARDMRVLKGMYMEMANFDDKGGQSFNVNAEKANAVEDKTIELVVVSLNGATEGIVELLMELPAKDYDEIFEKVQEVTGLDKKKEN